MGVMIAVIILVVLGAGLFALGYVVGRRSRPAEVRGFDVVSVDEKQH
jgi:hypothetical protein